jgi:vanillate O-demethylase ferredoxin subunit
MARQTLNLTVAAVRQEAEAIKAFELVDPAGGELPAFEPGAHVVVELPNGIRRQYSLSSDWRERKRYEVAVYCEPESRGGSRHMHEGVGPGDTLAISPPANNFRLRPSDGVIWLIAGGIGITPILAMARQLEARGHDYRLHYCVRTAERAAYRDLLEQPPFGSKVRFHFDGGDPAKGLDVGALCARHPEGGRIYCCGPTGLMHAVQAATTHWPEGTVRFEFFTADPEVLTHSGRDGSFEVVVNGTGETLVVGADQTILEVLEDHGIQVERLCEEGFCGTCITGVLEGEPDHRDTVLDDAERAGGKLMTVCCSRARSRRLVLDL